MFFIAADFEQTQCNMQHINLLFQLITLERIGLVGLFFKVCAGSNIQSNQNRITPKGYTEHGFLCAVETPLYH